MTARLSDNNIFSNGKLSVTAARLNPPFYIKVDNVFAFMLKNQGDTPLLLHSVSFVCEGFIEGSAVMFVQGKKSTLNAVARGNKITLGDIKIPPRESVVIFYRAKLT